MRSVSTIIARLCLAFLPVFFLLTAEAQQNSPFTRYGLGEFYSNQHIISRSMGGLSAAYADGANNNVGQSINFSNPATYSQLSMMVTFDLGFTIDSRSLASKTPANKFSTNNFVPGYLTLGVPLNKKRGLGIAFGLKPLSSISYSIETRERIAGDSLQTVYEGSGGLNQVFVGIGKKWKGLSLGFNTGYNFGRKDIATNKAFINDTVSYYQSKTSSLTNFGGVFLDGGMQYEFSVRKKITAATKTTENYLLRFGVSGTVQQRLKATQDQSRQTYIVGVSGDIKIDSISEQNNIKGTIVLPSTYAAGVTFHKATTNSRGTFEMWSIGAEFTATNWTNYRFYDQADRLSKSWQYKIGAQFSPDPLSGVGYWNNVNYRVGFMTGKDYLNADGLGLKHYAVSFGAGLPIRKWRSYDNQFTFLNTALQFGKRGSAVNNITESYFQFSLGISLSDLWFIKRKYD
jgi:hypothetical protein